MPPASEPCSYNGLNDRVLAAFRPSSTDVSHDLWRAPPAGRVLADPVSSRSLPVYLIQLSFFFCLASAGCAFPGRGDVSFFRSADPMAIGSALVVYITTYVAGVKLLSEPGFEGLKE